jgi:hypothetical protein
MRNAFARRGRFSRRVYPAIGCPRSYNQYCKSTVGGRYQCRRGNQKGWRKLMSPMTLAFQRLHCFPKFIEIAPSWHSTCGEKVARSFNGVIAGNTSFTIPDLAGSTVKDFEWL